MTAATADPLAPPDSRSYEAIFSRGAANYGSSMSANGSSAPDTNIGNSGNANTDAGYWTSINNIYRDTSQLEADSQQQVDRNKADLASAYDTAYRNYGKARENSKNSYAGKGMLYSGQFIKDQADVGESYNRTANEITQTGQRGFEDLVRQVAAKKALIEQQRLDIERQQAQAKANEDLKRALIEAQTKAYADFKAAMTATPAQSSQALPPPMIVPPAGLIAGAVGQGYSAAAKPQTDMYGNYTPYVPYVPQDYQAYDPGFNYNYYQGGF